MNITGSPSMHSNANRIGIYGDLHELSGTSAPRIISIVTAGTYYGWTTAAAGPFGGGVILDTANATADTIQVPKNGDYRVGFTANFRGASATIFKVNVHVNGAISTVQLEQTGDNTYHTKSISKILNLTADDLLDLRVTADVNSSNFVSAGLFLNVEKVS